MSDAWRVETAGGSGRVRRAGGWYAAAGGALAGMLAAVGVWLGYPAILAAAGAGVGGARILPRADDDTMPHLWAVLHRFGRPESVGGTLIWLVVAHACLFALGVLVLGFAAGKGAAPEQDGETASTGQPDASPLLGGAGRGSRTLGPRPGSCADPIR